MDRKKYEVPLESLVWTADSTEFSFPSTEQLPPPAESIDIVKGQEEAKKALRMAIELRQNAILIGPAGSGKSLLAKTVAEHYSHQNLNRIKLYDQLLVRNLENDNEPLVLMLPTPLGKEFAHDYRLFMKYVRDGGAFSFLFSSSDPLDMTVRFRQAYYFTTKTYTEKVKKLLEHGAEQTGYKVVPNVKNVLQKSSVGVLDTPVLNDGKTIHTLREIYGNYEFDEAGGRNDQLRAKQMERIIAHYKPYPEVTHYLEASLKEFYENADSSQEQLETIIPHMKKFQEEKYMANLIVDNAETVGIPIQYIENPSLQNIIGGARHDPLDWTPMHMRVKAGKLHKGNGGIVVIDELITLLQDIPMRNHFLTILSEKKGRIGGGHGLYGGGTSQSVETMPVAADCIIIGCANEDIFGLMTEKIARRFPHKVKFQATMDNTLENRLGYASFISYEINKHNDDPSNEIKLLHYAPDGVAAVIEWGVRYAQKHAHGKSKLTNILDPVGLLVKEASMLAAKENASLVHRDQVYRAKEGMQLLSSQMQKEYVTSTHEGLISIKVTGQEVGVINGLVVLQDGFDLFSFGFPTRIIAVASPGKGNFEHIQKEAGFSGKNMTQAHFILRSYFANKFGQHNMDHIFVSVGHEQSYGTIDGDSASIATAIAVKSALAELPVGQSIAMTGSMNKKGEVQPIGGVNEKIEGYYAVCKKNGFTGDQGVIIPKGNVPDLMLAREVINDITANKFHIYAVSHLDEVVELAFGQPASHVDGAIAKRMSQWRDNYGKKS